MESLAGMAVFAEVARARSFSGAARSLGLSKSAVSKQIARLEGRLGARLINRTTRRLSLTEAGAVFYERCARIVAEAAEAERLVDVVGEGFDLAVRIAQLPPSSLVGRRLAVNRRIVCGSPDYLAEHGVPRVPQDLRRHSCLNYSYLASGDEWHFRGPEGPITVRVAGSCTANNGDVLVQAAITGIGLILTPTFLVGEALRSGLLVPVLGAFCDSDTGIYALWPQTRHLSPKVRALVDFLAARFGPVPEWDAGPQ